MLWLRLLLLALKGRPVFVEDADGYFYGRILWALPGFVEMHGPACHGDDREIRMIIPTAHITGVWPENPQWERNLIQKLYGGPSSDDSPEADTRVSA